MTERDDARKLFDSGHASLLLVDLKHREVQFWDVNSDSYYDYVPSRRSRNNRRFNMWTMMYQPEWRAIWDKLDLRYVPVGCSYNLHGEVLAGVSEQEEELFGGHCDSLTAGG